MKTKTLARYVFHPLLAAAILLTAGSVFAQAGGSTGSTTICHGSPNNPQTMTVNANALAGHIPGHPGDYLGPCVAQGQLKVNKVLNPSTDPGKFNLRIDGNTAGTGANVGNGGTTGTVVRAAGPHTVSETAGTGTSLSNYTSVITGDCAPNGAVTLAAGDNKTCIITNTRIVTSPVSSAIISNLPMQGGTENTPCPPLGVVLPRSTTTPVYLAIMLPGLDMQCSTKGPGFKLQSIKFLTCAPDPRGPGFGPNATADLTCGP